MRRAVAVFFLALCTALGQAASPPQITSIGSAASYMPEAALGSIASIFGSNLSDAVYGLQRPMEQTSLGNTQVTVCDRSVKSCAPARLLYVAPTQINFVLPDVIPGSRASDNGLVAIFVTNSKASPTISQSYSLKVSSWAPDIFLAGYDASVDPKWPSRPGCVIFSCTGITVGQPLRAALTDMRGGIVSSRNPARLGSYYSLWLTGLGVPAKASLRRTAPMRFARRIGYGEIVPTITFAGPAPDSIGLDQVNIYLPPDAVPATCQDQWLEYSLQPLSRGGWGQEAVTLPLFVPASCQPGTFNLNGNWTITMNSRVLKLASLGIGSLSTASGTLTQSGAFLSGTLALSGTSCATSGAVHGTIVESGQVDITLEQNGQPVHLSGTVSSDQNSASGSFTAADDGCTDGDQGMWSAIRVARGS